MAPARLILSPSWPDPSPLLHDHRARMGVGFHATEVHRVPVGARLVELDLAAAVADVELDSVIALERHVRVPATRRVDECNLFSNLDLHRVGLVFLAGDLDGGARPRSS